MVDCFLQQQVAVCTVLADNIKEWNLIPKEVDITTMKKFKNVLGSLMDLTNALSGEPNLGISSVLSLLCKAESVLEASALTAI